MASELEQQQMRNAALDKDLSDAHARADALEGRVSEERAKRANLERSLKGTPRPVPTSPRPNPRVPRDD